MNFKILFRELFIFGLKQAYACIFGAFLLGLMIVTSFWYPIDFIHRYDFIFLSAIAFQLILIAFGLETNKEALVIIIFHLVATLMELFKTSDAIGSWSYPEDYVFGIGNVPLFTGFLYSAVGSYIARVWRIFDFEFSYYPAKKTTLALVILIYINFFTHHYIWDIRWVLMAAVFLLFYRTSIYFKIDKDHRHMPILLGWFLVAFFIWIAENIGTFTNVWIYPNQAISWSMVSFDKISSWFLLMLLSFVLVSLVNKIKIYRPEN